MNHDPNRKISRVISQELCFCMISFFVSKTNEYKKAHRHILQLWMNKSVFISMLFICRRQLHSTSENRWRTSKTGHIGHCWTGNNISYNLIWCSTVLLVQNPQVHDHDFRFIYYNQIFRDQIPNLKEFWQCRQNDLF